MENWEWERQGRGMAEKLDPRQVVTFEELLRACRNL
jgi:hypothetical protein